MRCNNCGWVNPDGLTRCQKCNQPLFSEDIIPEAEPEIHKTPAESLSQTVPMSAPELKRTVAHISAETIPLHETPKPVVAPEPVTEAIQEPIAMPEPVPEVKPEPAPVVEPVAEPDPVPAVPELAPAAKPLPKRTVFIQGPGNNTYAKEAAAPVSKPNRDLRRTMVDVDIEDLASLAAASMKEEQPQSPAISVKEEKTELVGVSEQTHKYDLSCMDGDSLITISSSSPLNIKEGDIILIAGLRYKA